MLTLSYKIRDTSLQAFSCSSCVPSLPACPDCSFLQLPGCAVLARPCCLVLWLPVALSISSRTPSALCLSGVLPSSWKLPLASPLSYYCWVSSSLYVDLVCTLIPYFILIQSGVWVCIHTINVKKIMLNKTWFVVLLSTDKAFFLLSTITFYWTKWCAIGEFQGKGLQESATNCRCLNYTYYQRNSCFCSCSDNSVHHLKNSLYQVEYIK